MTTVERRRLFGACVCGITAAGLAWQIYAQIDNPAGDFDQHWYSARALLRGENPYQALWNMGMESPVYYPATASTLALPLAALPLALARVTFIGLGIALLAFALRPGWRLIWLASGPVLTALATGQYTTYATAGVILAPVAMTWAAKPQLAIALFAAWPSRRALAWALAALGLSLLVRPSWPWEWLEVMHEAEHIRAAVTRPGGAILLLALLRWRRPEARLLTALAVIPHTESLYDLVPLGLIPNTLREMLLLVGFSLVAVTLQPAPLSGAELAPSLEAMWPYAMILLYLPCLILVLRRPNEDMRAV